jgi:hypothetical protein
MPLDKSRLDRMIDSIDQFLKNAVSDNQNTDPIQFGEDKPRDGPIAEPPATPLQDSTMPRRKDLFK